MLNTRAIRQFPINLAKLILIIITSCVLAVNVITIDRINHINEDLSERKNEATWFILQLVKEYSNFITQTHITPLDTEKIWLSYDLTWSRFDIILNSKESANFIKQANYHDFFIAQFDKFKALERSLKLLQEKPELQTALNQRIKLNFNEVIHFINNKFQIESPLSEKSRTLIERLLVLQKVSTVALIVLFIVISVIFWIETKMRQTIQRRDPLTRLLNRVALTTDIKANLTAPHYNLLSIRVQNVAEVNQKYGIDYGDVIIKAAAQRVTGFLTDDLLLYRYSGAQFIILGKAEGSLISDKLVQRIKEELSKTIELSDMELVLDVSLSQEVNLKRSSLTETLTQLSRKALST